MLFRPNPAEDHQGHQEMLDQKIPNKHDSLSEILSRMNFEKTGNFLPCDAIKT